MQYVKCEKGHVFDKSVTETCPICTVPKHLPPIELEPIQLEPIQLPKSKDGYAARCPKGHVYDSVNHAACPVCAGKVSANPTASVMESEDSFANFPDPENTLLFTAFQDVSFRIWREDGSFRMLLRNLLRTPPMILQEEMVIPDQDAWYAANRILDILPLYRNGGVFSGKNSGKGTCRLYFNTRQRSCDYRWELPSNGSDDSAEICMKAIHAALADIFGWNQDMSSEKENQMAELACGDVMFRLWNKQPGAEASEEETVVWHGPAMPVKVLTLYKKVCFWNRQSVTLRESVTVSDDAAWQLIRWLSGCGLMEALIKKNARPYDPLPRYSDQVTAFCLKNQDLTYSYRDWNNRNSPEEEQLLNQAKDRMLDVFIGYRKE